MKKTKKIIFELEVEETFNPYKFFETFKKIQWKGFFKNVIRVSRLDSKGQAKEMIDSETERLKNDAFILSEQYGVK